MNLKIQMKFVMKFACLSAALFLCGCLSQATVPDVATAPASEEPEKLFVHEDGRMEFRDRMMSEDDVIIYADGNGGERAAIRIRAQPVHPDYFRDSIVVERH